MSAVQGAGAKCVEMSWLFSRLHRQNSRLCPGPAPQRPARPPEGASHAESRRRSQSGAVHAGRSRPLLRVTVYCAWGGATARCDRHFRRGLDVSSRRDGGEAGAGGSAEGDGGPGRRPRGRGERPRPALLLPPGHGGLLRRAEPRLPPAPRRHAGWAGPAGRERAAGGGERGWGRAGPR